MSLDTADPNKARSHLALALELSPHGVGLARAGLSVREARGHPTLEDGGHQGARRVSARISLAYVGTAV